MLWLWYVAVFAYMVAMLTFLFDDFYAGGDKRPMAEYLRVYGIIDVVIFGVLVLLEMGSNAVRAAASSFFILVWAHTPPHILLFLGHLAYMIVACIYIFAGSASPMSTPEQRYTSGSWDCFHPLP